MVQPVVSGRGADETLACPSDPRTHALNCYPWMPRQEDEVAMSGWNWGSEG